MAEQLKLVLREDFVFGDVGSLDLLANGYGLARNGWSQAVASDIDAESVDEVLTLNIVGTDQNDLAAKVRALEQKIREVEYFRDDAVEIYGVWLRAQLANESNARQAFILNARRSPTLPVSGIFVRHADALDGYQLGLTRMPWWEATGYESSVTTLPLPTLNCLGGMATSPLGIAGNIPGRIARMIIRGASGGPLNTFWIGFRTDRLGDKSKFVPYWDCALGITDTDTTTAADSTARNGNKAVVSFATNQSLVPRLYLLAGDVTADHAEQAGEYQLLLRMKTNSTAVCRVRVSAGMWSTTLGTQTNWATKAVFEVENTSWDIYDIGIVTLPPLGRIVDTARYVQRSGFKIDAQLVSGSGSLDLDCFFLVPREGFVYVSGAGVQDVAGDDRPIYVTQHPDGQQVAGWFVSDVMEFSSQVQIVRGIPHATGGVRHVLVGARDGVSVKGDTVVFENYYYPRYASLRGSI